MQNGKEDTGSRDYHGTTEEPWQVLPGKAGSGKIEEKNGIGAQRRSSAEFIGVQSQ